MCGKLLGKEMVEASCIAYSPGRYFLNTSLATINGLGLSGSPLNAQLQARHRASVSVLSLKGEPRPSIEPQEANAPEEGAGPSQANPEDTGQSCEHHWV